MVWAVVLGAGPGEVGVIGANFTDGNDGGGPWRSDVAWENDGAEVGLAAGGPGRISGIDKKPIIITGAECGERVASGRLGQNGRRNVVGAREVEIKIRCALGYIPGHANGVGRFRSHAEVGGRRRRRYGAPSASGPSTTCASLFPGKGCKGA